MILFKACPRCGGDVDATYHDDVYCVQCAFRPVAVFPGPRILGSRPPTAVIQARSDRSGDMRLPDLMTGLGILGPGICCPKCGSERLVELERMRPEDNICCRCRTCGHIFSPRVEGAQRRPDAALP